MESSLKNRVLLTLSKLIDQNRQRIISENQLDIAAVKTQDCSIIDRLSVNSSKIDGMIQSLNEVAKEADPVDKVLYSHLRKDGLQIVNRSVPFGTILIIYESRPDVTIEAAATAFKAGNRILLKGGRESHRSNLYLTQLWHQSLEQHGVEKEFIQYLELSREETQSLIRGEGAKIDLIIPRGGESLINFIKRESSVPIIVSGRGNNFLYVDRECDIEMAFNLIVNGKERISVCNAIDKVVIDKNLPNLYRDIGELVQRLSKMGIEVISNRSLAKFSSSLTIDNSEEVLYREFLAPKIYLSLVEGIEEAIEVINRYSGGHSAVIVTSNQKRAESFMGRVDCAALYHNASSRFTDGGQFGVGAEIAISTQKLHFRGPLGAKELVTNKWFIYGNGQIRV
ncbi:MAG: glutamate-5-semialdehyde dehydrogenase [Bacteroidales bacterium]